MPRLWPDKLPTPAAPATPNGSVKWYGPYATYIEALHKLKETGYTLSGLLDVPHASVPRPGCGMWEALLNIAQQ